MAEKIDSSSEVLFRQIHPSWIDEGKPFSRSFVPSKKDNDQLSVDRSSVTTAEEAHSLYTSDGSFSESVYGLTVEEFSAETINCFPDPLEATEKKPANPAHAFADFSHLKGNTQEKTGKRLKAKAVKRGCLYRPV